MTSFSRFIWKRLKAVAQQDVAHGGGDDDGLDVAHLDVADAQAAEQHQVGGYEDRWPFG